MKRQVLTLCLIALFVGSSYAYDPVKITCYYQTIAMFDYGKLTMPANKDTADLEDVTITNANLKDMLETMGVTTVHKAFPSHSSADSILYSPFDNNIRVISYPFHLIYVLTQNDSTKRADLIDSLESYDDEVIYAEINDYLEAQTRFTFDPGMEDARFDSLWNLDNQDHINNVAAYGGIDIMYAWNEIAPIWEIEDNDIRIGLCDRDITNHPELSGRFMGQFIPVDFREYAPFHAFHVAGIMAAEGNNGTGIAGIHWDAKVYSRPYACIVESENPPGFRTEGGSQLGASRNYELATEDNCRFINNSWGINEDYEQEVGDRLVRYSYTMHMAMTVVNQLGVLVVSSRGNRGDQSLDCPASIGEFMMNVGSLRYPEYENDLDRDSTSYGYGMDLLAPGGTDDDDPESFWKDILSLENPYTQGNDGYTWNHGTSFAAPHATGMAALLYEYVNCIHGKIFFNDDLQALLKLTTHTWQGMDNDEHGSGLLNAKNAIEAVGSDKVIFHKIKADSIADFNVDDTLSNVSIMYHLVGTHYNDFFHSYCNSTVYEVRATIDFDDYTEEIQFTDYQGVDDVLVWANSLPDIIDDVLGYEPPFHYIDPSDSNHTLDFCYNVTFCEAQNVTDSGCDLVTYVYYANGTWLPAHYNNLDFYFTVIAKDDVAPEAVQNFIASEAGDGTIDLFWDANDEPDLAGYKIYRLVVGLEGYTLLDTIPKDSTHYNDSDYAWADSSMYYNAYYRMFAFDRNDNVSISSDTLNVQVEKIKKMPGERNPFLPERTEFLPSYPNPFNSIATLHYALRDDCPVDLKIYNMMGQLIYSKSYNQQKAGYYHHSVDLNSFSSGLYIIQVSLGDYQATRKVIMVK